MTNIKNETSLFEEITKSAMESYNIRFNRWFEKISLIQQIRISAAKGYGSMELIPEEWSDKDKLLFVNKNFIVLLQERLPGFTVNRIEYTKKHFTLGGWQERRYEKVAIRWRYEI